MAQFAASDSWWKVRAAAVKNLSARDVLEKVALEDKDADVRQAAAEKLTGLMVTPESDQNKLAEIVTDYPVWAVRKAAFNKITDQAVLESLAAQKKDPSVAMAARVLLRRSSWENICEQESDNLVPAGVVIGAMALFERQGSMTDAVTKLFHNYLRKDGSDRIPELVELFNLYGYNMLADDYLNSGRNDLQAVAAKWAAEHNYIIDNKAPKK